MDPEGGSPKEHCQPLLSNIYLDPLDQEMARRGIEMVRYADDFVILCRSRQKLRRRWSWAAVDRGSGMQLHPVKTRIVDATQKGASTFWGTTLNGI